MVDKILLMSPTSSLTICSRFSDFCRSLKRVLFEMIQQLDQLDILAQTYNTFSMTRLSFLSRTCSLHAERFFTFSFSSFSSPRILSKSVLKLCILRQNDKSKLIF